jgi:hypothetical protein
MSGRESGETPDIDGTHYFRISLHRLEARNGETLVRDNFTPSDLNDVIRAARRCQIWLREIAQIVPSSFIPVRLLDGDSFLRADVRDFAASSSSRPVAAFPSTSYLGDAPPVLRRIPCRWTRPVLLPALLNATPPERRGMTGWGRCMPRPVRSLARCRSPRSDPAGAGCGPSASAERYGLPLRSERPSGLPRRRGDAATQGSAWHFALQGEVPCDVPQSGAVTSIQQPINLANRCQRVRSECPPTPGLNL